MPFSGSSNANEVPPVVVDVDDGDGALVVVEDESRPLVNNNSNEMRNRRTTIVVVIVKIIYWRRHSTAPYTDKKTLDIVDIGVTVSIRPSSSSSRFMYHRKMRR